MKIEPNPKLVGKRIHTLRTNLGLSMKDFAERIDEKAKSGTVSNWETGKNLPNNKRLKRIAEIAGISVEQLLYGRPFEFLIDYFIELVPVNKPYIPSITLASSLRDIHQEIVDNSIPLSDTEKIKQIVESYIPEIEKQFSESFDQILKKAINNIDYFEETLQYMGRNNIVESFAEIGNTPNSFLKYLKGLENTNVETKAENYNFLEDYINCLETITEKGYMTDYYAYSLDWNDFLDFIHGSLNIEENTKTEYLYYRSPIDLPNFEKGLLIPTNSSKDKLVFLPLFKEDAIPKKIINRKCFLMKNNTPHIGLLINQYELMEENSGNIINIKNNDFIAPILVEFY